MQVYPVTTNSLAGQNVLSEASSHECYSTNGLSERCRFCKVCGVYLSNSLMHQRRASLKFLRSRRFDQMEPSCANSNEILDQMIARQPINRYYNVGAQSLHRRGPLIDWMQKLCQSLEYSMTTFYLAVSYLDAVFSLCIIKDNQLRLMGYITLFMAAKMEEEDSKIPTLKQSLAMFRDEYTEEEFVECEKFVFKLLNYNMNLKTPFSFLMFFFSKGFISSADLQGLNSQQEIYSYIENVEKLALFFLDLSVREYEFYKFTSIAIAATVIACARKCVGIRNWSIDLEKLTFISWEAIKDCKQKLMESFESNYPEMYESFFPSRNQITPHSDNINYDVRSIHSNHNLVVEEPIIQEEQGSRYTPLTKNNGNTTPTRGKDSKFISTADQNKNSHFLMDGKSPALNQNNDCPISEFCLDDDEDLNPNSLAHGHRSFGSDLQGINLREWRC